MFPAGENCFKPVLVLYNHRVYVLKLRGKKAACFGATEMELLILHLYLFSSIDTLFRRYFANIIPCSYVDPVAQSV